MTTLSNHFSCGGQRACSIKRLALILYIVLLVVAAVLLIWAGLYLYFVPAIAAVAPLFLGIACVNCLASAHDKTGSFHHADQFDSAAISDLHLKIVDPFHPSEPTHTPAPVNHIRRHEYSCINLQPWRPYTHAELLAATNNFDKSFLLGRGGEADVFRGIDQILDEGAGNLCYGRDIAVKRFYFASESAEELHHANLQFHGEVKALSRASHRNVVEFYGYCIHGRERLLVSELMPNGSLHDVLFRHSEGDDPRMCPLDWEQRLSIAKDAARGLDYLHNYCNLNLVHLDIKPQNILLDEMLHAKIADFGLSRLIGRDHTFLTGCSIIGGTLGYRAPELNCSLRGWQRNVTKKADVYSFGIVLLQLASGRSVSSSPTVDSAAPTFVTPGQTFRDAAFHLVRTQQTQSLMDVNLDKAACSNKVGQSLLEIGAMCVEIDPENRPDMHQVNLLLDGISV